MISNKLKSMLDEVKSKNRYKELKIKTDYKPKTDKELIIEILDYTGVDYKIIDQTLNSNDEVK